MSHCGLWASGFQMWARTQQNQQNDMLPVKTQISLGSCPVWSVFAVRIKKPWSLASHWGHSQDSDQTGQMPRLIWVFAGCTAYSIVFVILWLIFHAKQTGISKKRKCKQKEKDFYRRVKLNQKEAEIAKQILLYDRILELDALKSSRVEWIYCVASNF